MTSETIKSSVSVLPFDLSMLDRVCSTFSARSSSRGEFGSDFKSHLDFGSSHNLLGKSVEALLVLLVQDTGVVSQSEELLDHAHNHSLVTLGVGSAVGSASLGDSLTIGTVDGFLGELGREVSVQFVKGLLLLGVELFHVEVHLVVDVNVVHAVLAGSEAGLRVINLVVDVTVLVVAVPEGVCVIMSLTGVHGAEKVEFFVLVGLIDTLE
jgi:hypothetical protein